MSQLDQLISQLIELQHKPAPFTRGEPLFWDDPHISAQMLDAHLNPDIDAASRRPETIDRSVKWLIETLGLKDGAPILDLGCGPGLYASRFARAGLQVTGVDYSQRSIDYATNYATKNKLNITYRYQNYLELNDENQYDAALLIYGDFCPLNPEQRTTLLTEYLSCPQAKWKIRVGCLHARMSKESMATKTNGTHCKADSGNQVRIFCLKKALTILNNPFGLINTP